MAIKLQTRQLNFCYQDQRILENVSVRFHANRITAITGPSGTGKSTFLSTLNRLWEEVEGGHLSGIVELHHKNKFINIHDKSVKLPELRRMIGMVFQMPNPLPMSIYKNVAFPLKLAGATDRKKIDERVEWALYRSLLLGEVEDRLDTDARRLSGGQQQRLCIARALVLEPEVLLLDEPTSSLDAEAGRGIEELLVSLKQDCTLIMVSHYQEQVQRIADSIYELRERKLHQLQ